MTDIDAALAELLDDVPATKRTTRIIMLTNPTGAQIRAIPLGSDVILAQPGSQMSGVWDESIVEDMAAHAENAECGHLHGIMYYLPPVPSEDSTLTAEAIALQVSLAFHGNLTGAANKAEADTVITAMLQSAVHMAREGMVYPPF